MSAASKRKKISKEIKEKIIIMKTMKSSEKRRNNEKPIGKASSLRAAQKRAEKKRKAVKWRKKWRRTKRKWHLEKRLQLNNGNHVAKKRNRHQ
jgi:hypothetical protein